MKNTQNGFGLVAAVLVVAAITAGSIAAVEINKSINSHATSTATTTMNVGQEGYLNANDENNGLRLGASTTVELGH